MSSITNMGAVDFLLVDDKPIFLEINPMWKGNFFEKNFGNNKILLEDIDHVVFYDKPFLKFERLIETYVAKSPLGLNSFRISLPIWLREKLFQKNVITNELKTIDKRFKQDKLFFSEHHYSHAASAF